MPRKLPVEEPPTLEEYESDEDWDGTGVPWAYFLAIAGLFFLPFVVVFWYLVTDDMVPWWNDIAKLGKIFGLDLRPNENIPDHSHYT